MTQNADSGRVIEREQLALLRRIVDAQAEDAGLWFMAETAAEAYLQQALRQLHAVIEHLSPNGRSVSANEMEAMGYTPEELDDMGPPHNGSSET